MPNTKPILILVACLALGACKQQHSGNTLFSKLALIDSMKTLTLLSESDAKLQRSMTEIGTQVLQNGDTATLAYYDPHEGALILQQIMPDVRSKKTVKFMLNNHTFPLVPSSFSVTDGQILLWFGDERTLDMADMAGNITRQLVFPADDKDQLYFGMENNVFKMGDRLYIPTYTATDSLHPNSVYDYIDRVFDISGDTAKYVGSAGRYPGNYALEPVKMREVYQLKMDDDNILYAFQGTDSLFQYNVRTQKGTMHAFHSDRGNKFAPFPEDKASDMQYILTYYRTAEQNFFVKYDPESRYTYVFKRLGKKDMKDAERFEFIVLDGTFNKVADIDLHDHEMYKDLFFVRKGCIYDGSLSHSTLYKYQLQ